MADEDKKSVEEETDSKPAEEKTEEVAAPEENKEEKTEEAPAEEAPVDEAKEEAPAEEADEAPSEEAAAEEEEVEVEIEEVKDPYAHLKPGMVVRVHLKIKETTPKGDIRERIQVFEGTILARKGQDRQSATITVRKVTGGIGVERIFPLQMPTIDKIEVVKELRVRRSKIYFIRKKRKKKLKEVKKAEETK